MFSRPQVIENSTQCFLLRTDILQKTVVECPLHFCHLLPTCDISPWRSQNSVRITYVYGYWKIIHELFLFFTDSPDCFSPQFQTPLHLCVAVNSLYSGHCRDLELESSLAKVFKSRCLYQSNICNLFLPGI